MPDRNSRFHKAVQYAQNRKLYLETYLEDGRCSLPNGLSRYNYLNYLLSVIPSSTMNDDDFVNIVPWSENIKAKFSND